MLTIHGTLGQVPLSRGFPAPDRGECELGGLGSGWKALAIVRDMGGKQRLEYPSGACSVRNRWMDQPSHGFRPKATESLFSITLPHDDDQGVVSVVDLAGHKRVLSSGWESEEGLAWSPEWKRGMVFGHRAGLQRRIYAVDLAGHQRLAFSALGGVTLQDIAPDGRMLLTRDEQRAGIIGIGARRDARSGISPGWTGRCPSISHATAIRCSSTSREKQGGPTYTVADARHAGVAADSAGRRHGGRSFSRWEMGNHATVSYTQLVLLPTGAGTIRRIDEGRDSAVSAYDPLDAGRQADRVFG